MIDQKELEELFHSDYLMHIGVGADDNPPGRGSGRYPKGSGLNPYQHPATFYSKVNELRKNGMSDKEIVVELNLKSTGQLRDRYTTAYNEVRKEKAEKAMQLRREGKTLTEITEEMGFKSDSSVRNLLNENSYARMNQARTAADALKEAIESKGMIDVGAGTELELGVSKQRLTAALELLQMEGYPVYSGYVPQIGGKGNTNIRVLCPKDTEYKEIWDYSKVHSYKDYEEEYNRSLQKDGTEIRPLFENPTSMSSKRLMINYDEDGGSKKDGIIEIRRGLDDLNLGDSHYAQVRIMVDGSHYLKGMAMYADDLPDGVDVRFNTNKHKGTPALGPKDDTVLKPVKTKDDGTVDEKNPFGALLKEKGGQYYYDDPKGKYIDPVTGKRQSLSPLNKTREEGDWGEWSDRLPSQFLAKQSMHLINRQLNLKAAEMDAELDEIMKLENPVVKRQLLNDYAESCDKVSVHLYAAALPGQKYQVILPLTSIKDNEIYAPNYKEGSKVALIRYPHAGTYEIPILTVNNKIKEGRDVIGQNAKDAIGISKKNADQLSGADFDGDTAMVIPINSKIKIQTSKMPKGLEGFDPKLEYGGKEEGTYKRMTHANTQHEMGVVSNLIMDMTLKGAKEDEMARATRHSMVVIDAEKHGLDYKQSEIDNDIKGLKDKYQNGGGVSTLLTRAKSQTSIDKTEGSARIDEEGNLYYKTARDDKLYYNQKRKVKLKDERGRIIRDSEGNPQFELNEKGNPVWVETGKIKKRTQKSNRMTDVKDARELISDRDLPQERAYADYANHMKENARKARKEISKHEKLVYSKEANKQYVTEVDSLNKKLEDAMRNAPREKQAQMIANAELKIRKQENPHMTKEQIGKEGQKALASARQKVGAKREPIVISDKEWEAIQAGAISDTRLTNIMKYADKDRLRELATPRQTKEVSETTVAKIQALAASGYTNAQIAEKTGYPRATVIKYI